MAIPTLLRQTDYAGVDFTDKAQGTFEVLKDALVDKFGWTLLFEDLASPNKSFVVANTGSQSCLKITKEDGDTTYLKFEAAQSYSDIDTPVNTIQSCYYFINFAGDYFNLIGDSKRFYFIISQSNEIINFNYAFFCGDIIPFTENDPNVFYLTPSEINANQFSSNKSSSYRGTLIDADIRNSQGYNNRTSNLKIYNQQGVKCTILSPGAIGYTFTDVNINNENPLILSEGYIVSQEADGTTGFNVDYGKLPGLFYFASWNKNLMELHMDGIEAINGFQCAALPCVADTAYNKGVILLNDWDVL